MASLPLQAMSAFQVIQRDHIIPNAPLADRRRYRQSVVVNGVMTTRTPKP